jgi:ATP-dependent DNA ligase
MASTAVNITDFSKLPGGISPDKRAYLFPQIDSINSHGKNTSWRIIVKAFKMRVDIALPFVSDTDFVEFDPEFLKNQPLENIYGYIYVESKIQDGKIKKIVPTIVSTGLNKGKANATNTICQALRDALSKHNKQLRKAKTVGLNLGQTERYPPMLAQVLKDQVAPLDFDEKIYTQIKYNGLRAIFTLDKIDGEDVCIAYSRTKLLYPGFDYIKQELLPILKLYWEQGMNLYFDGELYKHGMELQDISGIARKEDKKTELNYLIYDCFISNKPEMLFSERLALLTEIFDNVVTKYAQQAPTFVVDSQEELDAKYNEFLKQGYEGAMVRVDHKYVYSYNSHHSKALLKMKPSYDAEYEVVGWGMGEKGKAAGALMMRVKTDQGIEFNVTPALGDDSMPLRMELAKKMETIEPNGKTYFENHYLGKQLIVEFDEKSKDGVPQRARTRLVIRDWA